MVSFSNPLSFSFDYSLFLIPYYFHCLKCNQDFLKFAWFDNRSIGLHMLGRKLLVSCIHLHYMLVSLCLWDQQLVFLPDTYHTRHQASERVCWSDASHKARLSCWWITWQLDLPSASLPGSRHLSTTVQEIWFSGSIQRYEK